MNGENFTDMLDRYLDARKEMQAIRDITLPQIERYNVEQRYEESRRALNELVNRILIRLLRDE